MERLELRSGTSRFVPRGTFSMSHWPNGFTGGRLSSHAATGTTTKAFRVPMRCGPSVSERRSTSDSLAFASATVQTRLGPETATLHPLRRLHIVRNRPHTPVPQEVPPSFVRMRGPTDSALGSPSPPSSHPRPSSSSMSPSHESQPRYAPPHPMLGATNGSITETPIGSK